MKTLVAALLVGTLLSVWGCSSEPAPVEGDNPIAANAVEGDASQAGKGEHMRQTTNAPGTGRGASAPVPPPTDGSLTPAK